MIVEPEQRVPDFIKAGADIVSVHCEQTATIHLHRTINEVSFCSSQATHFSDNWIKFTFLAALGITRYFE